MYIFEGLINSEAGLDMIDLPILIEPGVVGTHPNETGAMDMAEAVRKYGAYPLDLED